MSDTDLGLNTTDAALDAASAGTVAPAAPAPAFDAASSGAPVIPTVVAAAAPIQAAGAFANASQIRQDAPVAAVAPVAQALGVSQIGGAGAAATTLGTVTTATDGPTIIERLTANEAAEMTLEQRVARLEEALAKPVPVATANAGASDMKGVWDAIAAIKHRIWGE